MKKYDKTPIDEDPEIFEEEKRFLNQEPNTSIYYLNGKIIVRGDGGDLYFTDLLEEDKEQFMFGEQLEAEFLHPISELPDPDKEQLYKLNQLNQEINPRGIYAVALDSEKEGNQETFYAYIAHPEHTENTYFRISIPNLHKLEQSQIDELPEYNEERTLNSPYHIQITDGMMLAY